MIDSTTPVVIPVGTEPGDMRDKVRRAIGVDLYKGE
jgi:vacuolar-type H+-ATPase subunit F/Vma7